MSEIEDKYLPLVRTMTPPKRGGQSNVSGIGTCYVEKVGSQFVSSNLEIGAWTARKLLADRLYCVAHACLLVGKPKSNGKGKLAQAYQFYKVVINPKK